jgi:hypothetical protein
MAVNNFTNTTLVCAKVLRLMLNKLVVADYFDRTVQPEFEKEMAYGTTVYKKFPQLYIPADGMGYQPQGINRLQTPVTLDQWVQISFEWDDFDTALKLERSEKELEENYFEPAAAAMAQEWDSRCASFAKNNTSMVVGALGTDPTSVQTYYQARQKLLEAACSATKLCMITSSSMMTTLGTNITTIFHPGDEITRMWKKGYIGELAGFEFFESQSLYAQTAGTWAGAVTVNGAAQSGTSMIVTFTAGDTVAVGDKFSIANVNRVNAMTRRTAGPLTVRTFVITQALTAAGGGADTINFLPPIYGPGSQYQNVDALPANGAALTLWPGTASPSGKSGTVALGLSREAFALVGTKLYHPTAVEKSGVMQDPDTGLSIRKVTFWDPVRSLRGNRMDSLGGFGNLYQDRGAVALVGA